MLRLIVLLLPVLAWALPAPAANISDAVRAVEPKVVSWRRDIHANPELGNREFRTAALVEDHLRGLGMEVEAGIAYTGVAGLLRGGSPGPTVALRADMDALPVTEQVDLPFASKVTTQYRGQEVGVMHACGHDMHVAILMGAAEVLAAQQDKLAGNVLFIFQPAEEGPPEGEKGGAQLMLEQGLFRKYQPETVFGPHVGAGLNVGMAGYRSGAMMAAADSFKIVVRGKQAHASRPWQGVDSNVTAAQILLGLQTIASRKVDVTRAPAIISVGSMQGGIRNNIIPDSAELWGTIRTFDPEMRLTIHDEIRRMAENTALAAGAEAEFSLGGTQYPVTVNDPGLTEHSVPLLREVLGKENVIQTPLITGAEDFAYYAREVPGFFVFLGATPRGQDPEAAPTNHSPLFFADEGVLPIGVELMVRFARSRL